MATRRWERDTRAAGAQGAGPLTVPGRSTRGPRASISNYSPRTLPNQGNLEGTVRGLTGHLRDVAQHTVRPRSFRDKEIILKISRDKDQLTLKF